MIENIENRADDLDIYIAYDRLRAADLSRLLGNMAFIADRMAEDYFLRIDGRDGQDPPSLDIAAIQTGNSVKIKLIEGWLPKVRSDASNDIIISLPKPLGITLGLGYLLLSGTNQYLDIEKKLQDQRIGGIEYRLKELELAKAIKHPDSDLPFDEAVKSYLNQKIPAVKTTLDDTIKVILHNKEITRFEVNGISIKNTDQQGQ